MSTNLTPGSIAGKQKKLSEATKIVNDYAAACEPHHLRSFTISAIHLKKIMAQPGCEYVRFIVGIDGLIQPDKVGIPVGHTLVAVGTDANGKNIKNGENDTEVYEDLDHCPPTCNGDSENL